MNKIIFAWVAIFKFFITAFGQQIKVPVFVSGTQGYKNYRIPAIVQLPNHDLVAFCEGRRNGAADFGDNDIVMKRSSDKGRTWGPLEVIADAGTYQASNAAPVVDLSDPAFPKGRIFLFYNTGNNHEGEVRKGNGLREVWYKTSTDNAVTWSAPVNITLQVHRPKQPQINPAYNFSEDWRSYANTPGHAMQFSSGRYKGRIYVAANHSAGEPQKQFMDYRAHGYYSDDHGKTFHLGRDVNIAGGNENMAAQLSHDKLMLNLRNQKGDIKARIIAISGDGGITWDTTYFDTRLPDPVCQGSIVTIGEKKRNNSIAFCNDADTKLRDNLTLRISFDDGKSWAKSIVIDKSPEVAAEKRADYVAYSDIVKVSASEIGILYEKGNYSQIVFTLINWKESK